MSPLSASPGANKERFDLHGLICGFVMLPDGHIQSVTSDQAIEVLRQSNTIIWLHFNGRLNRAREWIAQCEFLPAASRQFLLANEERKRLDRGENHLIGAISDIRYDLGLDFDPEQIATLWFHLDQRCLISTRLQPANAADQLRTVINKGQYFDSTVKLMLLLFESQITKLNQIIATLNDLLDDIEDKALAGRRHGQQAQLGSIRRMAVRLFHHFSPENRLLHRLLRRPPDWFSQAENTNLLEIAEEFREIADDLAEIQERAKLLQEELAAGVAEETSKNLYILSLFTAVLLPSTLITGVFGMNVAGLPGLEDPDAFLWVMSGLLIVACLVLVILRWRRLI